MRSRNTRSLLSAALLGWSAVSCTEPDAVSLHPGPSPDTGGAQLALRIGNLKLDTLTAVLSHDGKVAQTQNIDLRGKAGVVSVYFGALPAGDGYSVALSAGTCSGSAEFEVNADAIALVEVALQCAGDEQSGSAQVTAALEPRPETAPWSAPVQGPAPASSALPAASPEPAPAEAAPAEPGACGRCAADYCAEPLAAVTASSSAAAALLECVLGANWAAGERADAARCGNLDVPLCYCGSIPGAACASSPTTAVDGACRAQILTATGCSDSSCVQSKLLEPTSPSGAALRYVRCQQDYCYDYCFNP
jgi:hypothetical protein